MNIILYTNHDIQFQIFFDKLKRYVMPFFQIEMNRINKIGLN